MENLGAVDMCLSINCGLQNVRVIHNNSKFMSVFITSFSYKYGSSSLDVFNKMFLI